MSCKIFLTLQLLTFSLALTLQGQECRDTTLTGFFIRKVEKQEQIDLLINDELRKSGKSFEVFIDYFEEVFFIPYNGPTHDLRLKNFKQMLQNDTLRSLSDVFLLPNSTMNYSIIPQYCDSIEFMLSDSLLRFSGDEYVSLDDSDKYAYEIRYAKAQAFFRKIDNSLFNRIYLNIEYYIPDEIPQIKCFFFYDILEVIDGREYFLDLDVWQGQLTYFLK